MNRLTGIAIAIAAAAAVAITYMITAGNSSGHTVSIDGIKAIAKLASIEYHVTELYDYKAPHKKLHHDIEILQKVKGIVVGQLDLANVDIDIDQENMTALITFPFNAVSVTDPEICSDEECLQHWDVKKGIVHVPSETRDTVIREAIEVLKQSADEAGIVKATKAEGKEILTRFLDQFGYTANVVFEEENLSD